MYKKNIMGSYLEPCSFNPMTGYTRTGYCEHHSSDVGSHYVCAKMNKKFLDFTKSKGNDLSSVVKSGENWCLCQNRWMQAYNAGKAPKVIKKSTNIKTRKEVKNIIKKIKSNKISRKFLYNPNNPKKSFDVYINKDPHNTISMKYTTLDDIKNTIRKLERLYKANKYPHKRIFQVGMILKVRLGAILKHHKTKYPNAKHVKQRYLLALKYFIFLKERTKLPLNQRKKAKFIIM